MTLVYPEGAESLLILFFNIYSPAEFQLSCALTPDARRTT